MPAPTSSRGEHTRIWSGWAPTANGHGASRGATASPWTPPTDAAPAPPELSGLVAAVGAMHPCRSMIVRPKSLRPMHTYLRVTRRRERLRLGKRSLPESADGR